VNLPQKPLSQPKASSLRPRRSAGAPLKAVNCPPRSEMGVLSGQRIERREVGSPGEFDRLTDDELERMLIEKIQELGLFQMVETQLLALGDGGVAAIEDETER
jgi:hypothetical protein